MTCANCGSTKATSMSHDKPKIDKELLDIWGNNPDLYFMKQDQGLMMAIYDYFPMFLEAIDTSKYPKEKIDILIEAICVLLYDNTVFSEEYSKKENKKREDLAKKIRPELIKRKNRIKEAGNTLWEYIQEVVYPQIGISL